MIVRHIPDYEQIARLVKPGGRPQPKHERDGQCCVLHSESGMYLETVPHDLPKWQTVYYYFRRWEADGTWEKIHDYLRAEVRVRAGRQVEPSAGIADTQSVKLLGKIRNTQLSKNETSFSCLELFRQFSSLFTAFSRFNCYLTALVSVISA